MSVLISGTIPIPNHWEVARVLCIHYLELSRTVLGTSPNI